MPLVERLPIGTGCAQWSAWGTVARIVVTDPARLDAATDLVRAELAAVDEACSRFRTDSEIRDVFRAHGKQYAEPVDVHGETSPFEFLGRAERLIKPVLDEFTSKTGIQVDLLLFRNGTGQSVKAEGVEPRRIFERTMPAALSRLGWLGFSGP